MPNLTSLFEQLCTAFAFEPAAEQIDSLAANFSAVVASTLYDLQMSRLYLQVQVQARLPATERLDGYLRTYGLILIVVPFKNRPVYLVGVRLADDDWVADGLSRQSPLGSHSGDI
jgi:hypothetical protein